MKTVRVVGTILLALAIVLGVALSVMPLGEAWAENDGTRTTETYSMFSKLRESNPAGQAADGESGVTWYYVDPGLDATGGIDYLRTMGFVLAAAMLLALGALLFTALPGINRTRTGAFFALPATVLLVATAGMAYLGPQLHAEHLLHSSAEVNFVETTAAAAAAAILFLAFATVLGFVGAGTKRTRAASAAPAPEPTPGRRLRCPDCSTVVAADYGVVPICPNCEFGADYDGPAAPPVPAQPVA